MVSGGDLSFAQKEQVLSGNAAAFFDLKDLPEPRALAKAMSAWEDGADGGARA